MGGSLSRGKFKSNSVVNNLPQSSSEHTDLSSKEATQAGTLNKKSKSTSNSANKKSIIETFQNLFKSNASSNSSSNNANNANSNNNNNNSKKASVPGKTDAKNAAKQTELPVTPAPLISDSQHKPSVELINFKKKQFDSSANTHLENHQFNVNTTTTNVNLNNVS